MKYRLIIGETGKVLFDGICDNAIDFLHICFADLKESMSSGDALKVLSACWFDAGADTLPVPISSINLYSIDIK